MTTPKPHAASAPERRHVVIADGDAALREDIAGYLREHEFTVHTAGTAAEMNRVLEAQSVDLVLLEVVMPGENGLSVCRRLSADSGVAIVMHSAVGDEIDRVLALELGADDYLTKPCSPRELLATVRAVLRGRDRARRQPVRRGARFMFSGYTLDVLARRLRAPNGDEITLTPGEHALLQVFLQHPQRVLSREQLIELGRGDADVFDRVIDVQVSRLRRKLAVGESLELLRTLRGVGYLFDAKVHRV